MVAKGTGQREGGRAPTRSGRPPGGAPWPSRARRPASRKPRPVGSATVMTVHLERTHARIHKRIRKYGDRLRICGSLGGYSPRARQPGMRHKSSVAAFAFLFNLGFVLAPHSCIYTHDYHTLITHACMHAYPRHFPQRVHFRAVRLMHQRWMYPDTTHQLSIFFVSLQDGSSLFCARDLQLRVGLPCR